MVTNRDNESASPVVHTPSSAGDWAAATELLTAYFRWLAPLAGVESVPAVQPWARVELADLADAYRRPGHGFLLARLGRLPVGIVGLRPTEETGDVELVRFFCRPAARGTGVGSALLTAAIEHAAELGHGRVVLDTAPSFMAPAIRRYEARGFVPADEPHQLPIEDGARYVLDLDRPQALG